MNAAVFFQKHNCRAFSFLKSIYLKLFIRSNESRVKYLRDSGSSIGENVKVPSVVGFGTEPWLVSIGNNVYFAGGTHLLTHDGAVMQLKYMNLTEEQYDSFGSIRIGDNCFIGIDVIVMKNCTIGNNCIIGAGSVVTKSIPDGSVACGVPAKVISSIEEYYQKNSYMFEHTFGMKQFQKRKQHEEQIQKYEDRRIKRGYEK